tara:strand:- start:825 stop:1112 length:288 start_codon:yes stop_codon:yes gene_type:complete
MYVYAIYYKDTPVYIGKTKNVKQRLKEHKRHCFGHNGLIGQLKLYKILREQYAIFEKDDWDKHITCKVLESAPARLIHDVQRYWMQKLKISVNNK